MKIAKITPIHKQNDKTRIDNYRPISLLPAISKIIERAILDQITTYFNINKLFHNKQYGFRKEHSTELAALEVIDRITCNIYNGKIPFNIYLDLSKAFDTLDHNILIEKLKFYSLTQSALTLLQSYLHERKQYVQINDAHSNVTLTSCGVPQGSILGPLLFIIYINDMALTSKYFKFIIYADDTTLMGNLNEFDINKELSKLSIWLKLNKLSFNVSKSKFMIFHQPRKKITIPSLEINNTKLECVNRFNFLGLEINAQLNWKDHVNKISNTIVKGLGLGLGIINKLKYVFPQSALILLYYSSILPHINYCILAWGTNTKGVFKLQKRAVRIITRSHYLSHTDPIFLHLKLLKVIDLYKLFQLKFYFKLTNQLLPQYFYLFDLKTNHDIHLHNTRQRHKLHITRVKHEFAKRCIRYQLPSEINLTATLITDKINTHSFNGFSNYAKTYMISKYPANCTLLNCFVCNHICHFG